MALIRRQTINFEIFDDQSPTLWNLFVGNWTRLQFEGFNNDTITATPTPGASLSFTFSGVLGHWPLVVLGRTNHITETGSQAWLYGGLINDTSSGAQNISYPTADYKIDGFSCESPPQKNGLVRCLPSFALKLVPKSHGLIPPERLSTSRHQNWQTAPTRLTSQWSQPT